MKNKPKGIALSVNFHGTELHGVIHMGRWFGLKILVDHWLPGQESGRLCGTRVRIFQDFPQEI